MNELLGRFWGCGVTKPRRDRIRQIVATDGTPVSPWRRARWTAIVCGAGVEALVGELLAELDDLVLDRLRGAARAPVRPA